MMTTQHKLQWFCAMAAGLILSGCANEATRIKPMTRSIKFEERYRLFFANKLPFEGKPTDSPETISENFSPQLGVSRAIGEFKQQGFKLAEIKQVPWSAGATVFVFRRRVNDAKAPLHAPIQFVGTYKVDGGTSEPTYYVFAQEQDRYQVHIIGPKGVQLISGKWEGRELIWDAPEGRNNLRLTPDAMTAYRVIYPYRKLGEPLKKIVIKADRVVPEQQPASNDAREARRFLVRLKPKTAGEYDPFPW
jgi:hypothetical protein